MPSIGIGYGNFSSNRRLQQVFAGQSVSSRPPRHSEQLSLDFPQTLCGTFSNGILRPRISQHHGRVNIVHAVPLPPPLPHRPLQRNNTCNRAGSFRTSRYRYSPHSCIRRAGRHLSGRERIPSAASPIPCLYNNRFGCRNAANPLWMYRFRVRCRTSQPYYPRKQRPDVPYPPETEPLPVRPCEYGGKSRGILSYTSRYIPSIRRPTRRKPPYGTEYRKHLPAVPGRNAISHVPGLSVPPTAGKYRASLPMPAGYVPVSQPYGFSVNGNNTGNLSAAPIRPAWERDSSSRKRCSPPYRE